MRGWSFSGYLAAAAVLRHPEVFHAAVAGAAPADRRLYDTHWEERFLGHPDVLPGNYTRNSLLDEAPALTRPLMLVHGLADDNVAVAHTLRLSAALLAAGRPHTVLPLSGSRPPGRPGADREQPVAAGAGLPEEVPGPLNTDHRLPVPLDEASDP